MLFRDRTDAGKQLGERLISYRNESPFVLALPRGGVVVGYEVARALNAPLDVIVARKLGAPLQPELGIGAIAPGGITLLDEFAVRYLHISEEDINRAVKAETREMERRLREYQGERPFPDLLQRTVIVVDDGLATGVTARAAIRSVRQRHPQRLVLAVPVCAPESAASFEQEVDEVVCLETPFDFRAVGLWYDQFDQTTDAEVIELLERSRSVCGDAPSSFR